MRRMYSQSQINQIVKNAIANGLLNDVDINAKTLSQSSPNVSVDFSEIEPYVIDTGIEYKPKYCRLEEINKVLHIIWNFGLKNPTAEIIQQNWLRINITLPEDIAKKIFDFNNKSVHENSSGHPITAFIVHSGSEDYPADLIPKPLTCIIQNTITPDVFSLNVYFGTRIKAGNELYSSGRVALTLI